MPTPRNIRVWECHSCGTTRSCAVSGEIYTKKFDALCYKCDPVLYENVSEEQKNKWLKGATL